MPSFDWLRACTEFVEVTNGNKGSPRTGGQANPPFGLSLSKARELIA